MHDENAKINRKKRLMSEQRAINDMAGCTFTPDLVTKKGDKSSDEPLDIKHLSLRLYQYADKFRENKDKSKRKLENERGEEIRFTPLLETAKVNSEMQIIKDRKNVYENLYEDCQKREQNKEKLKLLYQTDKKKDWNSSPADDGMVITIRKPGSIKGKHVNFYENIGEKSSKKSSPSKPKKRSNMHAKVFSANLY